MGAMEKLLILAVISCTASLALADYNGPFLLWGRDDLKNIDVPALSSLDEQTLRNLLSESSAIILFVRNSTSRLDKENYPSFSSLINHQPHKYLTQYWLPADPIDFNVNAEVSGFIWMAISVILLCRFELRWSY